MPHTIHAATSAPAPAHVPRNVLIPVIPLFCVIGAFAINNSLFDVGVTLVFGLLAYVKEANGFPLHQPSPGSCSVECSSRTS